eukprot:Opistho-2@43121
MVVCEGNIHHRADLNLSVDGHGAIKDSVHAENSRLRGIDDRRAHKRPIHPSVRDGEGPANHVLDGNVVRAGLCTEGSNRLFDIRKGHLFAVAENGDNKTLGRCHGDANVDIIAVDNLLTLNNGIDDGLVLEGDDRGLDKSRHEAELNLVLLEKIILELVAQCGNVAHVNLVECGEHRIGVLSLLQTLGNGEAHTRHLDPTLRALSSLGGLGDLRGRGFLLWCSRGGRSLRRLGGGGSLGGLCLGGRGSSLLLGGRRRLGLGGSSGGGRGSGSTKLQLEERSGHNDLCALFSKALDESARLGCVDLNIDLIGLNNGNDVVAVNKVANVLCPPCKLALCDRVGHVRCVDNLELIGSHR